MTEGGRTWLVAACVLGLASGVCAECRIYVDATAAVDGDGGRRAPYQTLAQARDGIRALRRSGTLDSDEAVTVYLGPGVYRLDQTFELTAEDSGSDDAPVVYRARKPGQTRIHGGITLTPDMFTHLEESSVLACLDPSVRGKVLVCDLSAAVPDGFAAFNTAYRGAPAGPWLYVDGRPMTLARWPNADSSDEGWASFDEVVDTGLPQSNATDPELRRPHPGAFVFGDPRPERWNLDKGVWLLGYWTHDWCDESIRIASYDKTSQVIRLAAPHSYGIKGRTWGNAKRRFFALNALEELDAPGEWYLDRVRKTLYFYAAAPIDDSLIVLATLTEPLVMMKDTKHVRFQELAFEYGHGSGIVLRDTENVEIAGCVVANCASGGMSVRGSGNTVRSCDLFNLGTLGIDLEGGDRKTLTPAGNLAVNNHIHHYAIFQRTYAPGIGVKGCGQIVRNNRIHDAPHNAVLYGGNEHVFELNDVYRVVMETGDAGAFYTGRDWTSQGNVLRHNYIHDLGGGDARHVNTMGVYLDDCDSGDTIEGNVFYRAGRAIMVGGGRDNPILNNLIVACPIGLHLDSRGMTWKQWNNTNDLSWCLHAKAVRLGYSQPPWSVSYPRLAAIMDEAPREPLNNPIRRNVFIDCTKKLCEFDGNVRKLLDKLEMADNLAVNSFGTNGIVSGGMRGFRDLTGSSDEPVDLGFRNIAEGDFTLRWWARLPKELPSFESIPFARIGIYKDRYRRRIPAR